MAGIRCNAASELLSRNKVILSLAHAGEREMNSSRPAPKIGEGKMENSSLLKKLSAGVLTFALIGGAGLYAVKALTMAPQAASAPLSVQAGAPSQVMETVTVVGSRRAT